MVALSTIAKHPKFKPFALRLIFPKNQARPRLWVKWFVNPFIHKKGKGSTIRRSTRMDVVPFNPFSIGSNSTIEDYAVINNGMGPVQIGERSRIGISCTIIGPVQIGHDVILAQNIVISGLNHGYQDVSIPIKDQTCSVGPVEVGDESWIGANAVITQGVKIGKHCIIAAGSVVTKSVPDYSVVAGNPARVLKQYNAETGEWERVKA